MLVGNLVEWLGRSLNPTKPAPAPPVKLDSFAAEALKAYRFWSALVTIRLKRAGFHPTTIRRLDMSVHVETYHGCGRVHLAAYGDQSVYIQYLNKEAYPVRDIKCDCGLSFFAE